MPGNRALQQAWGTWLEQLTQWEWYLTLTFREIVHPEAAEKCWTRFIREVEESRRTIRWARALEYQRRGVIHFHALTAGMDLLSYQAVRRRWTWGYSWIEPYELGRGAHMYLGKYLAKGGEIDLSKSLVDHGDYQQIPLFISKKL